MLSINLCYQLILLLAWSHISDLHWTFLFLKQEVRSGRGVSVKCWWMQVFKNVFLSNVKLYRKLSVSVFSVVQSRQYETCCRFHCYLWNWCQLNNPGSSLQWKAISYTTSNRAQHVWRKALNHVIQFVPARGITPTAAWHHSIPSMTLLSNAKKRQASQLFIAVHNIMTWCFK